MENTKTIKIGSKGIGVFGLLGVAFVVLKLCNVITWSWWLVTLPFWGFFGLLASLLMFVGLFYLVVMFFSWVLDWKIWRKKR